MAYQKLLVDNTTCSRRFHITYDDEAALQNKVMVNCLYCGAVIFEKEQHAPVSLVRDENLIKTTELSNLRTKRCLFKDNVSPAPVDIE